MISLTEPERMIFHHRWLSLRIAFHWAFPEMGSSNLGCGSPEQLSPEDLDVEEKRDETLGGLLLFIRYGG
jgi:hypothetical protein